MSKLIFLSHIHEERELAILIKDALEDEFGGFVDVFVSSDGTSIAAGANFLKRIEEGLATCSAALYLISPKSVVRQWINFELGAVWIRNLLSINAGQEPIPAVPLCHSGSRPATLPAPLNNLNGIIAGDAAQLEFAFRSIQSAMGGKGRLKTDFNELVTKIADVERKLTVGRHLKEMFSLLPDSSENLPKVIEATTSLPANHLFAMKGIWVEDHDLKRLHELAANELRGLIMVMVDSAETRFTNLGTINGAQITVTVDARTVQEFKDELRGK